MKEVASEAPYCLAHVRPTSLSWALISPLLPSGSNSMVILIPCLKVHYGFNRLHVFFDWNILSVVYGSDFVFKITSEITIVRYYVSGLIFSRRKTIILLKNHFNILYLLWNWSIMSMSVPKGIYYKNNTINIFLNKKTLVPRHVPQTIYWKV